MNPPLYRSVFIDFWGEHHVDHRPIRVRSRGGEWRVPLARCLAAAGVLGTRFFFFFRFFSAVVGARIYAP